MESLILGKYTVSDFLEQYRNINTRIQYRSLLKQYFTSIYPELNNYQSQELVPELDRLSLQYFKEQRDIRKDLVTYTNQIQQFAPKTRTQKLNAIFRYFEDNGIDVPKQLRRNLVGQETEAISEEYVPKPEDLKRVLARALIKQLEPRIIVVANAKAARIFKNYFGLAWSDTNGCHVTQIDNKLVQTHLTGMLTGQRALDNESFKMLKWNIKNSYNSLNKKNRGVRRP